MTAQEKWSRVVALAFIGAFALHSNSVDAFTTITQGTGLKTVGQMQKFAPVSKQTPKPSRDNTFEVMSKKRENSQLNMTPVHSGAAALMGITSGGFIGGALHAIAGPDHLAALLPRCCGQRWFRGSRIGALWGMGHGISAALIGLIAFGLKNHFSFLGGSARLLQGASSAVDLAVGASLILIGILGIKEAKEWQDDINVSPQSLSSAATEAGVKYSQKRAVILNGLLHGFSWDGAPSLAPALAVNTWRGSAYFLLAYGIGTTVAMTLATTIIGESTRRAGELFQRPDIPQKLSMYSSFLATGVGSIWCFLALM